MRLLSENNRNDPGVYVTGPLCEHNIQVVPLGNNLTRTRALVNEQY